MSLFARALSLLQAAKAKLFSIGWINYLQPQGKTNITNRAKIYLQKNAKIHLPLAKQCIKIKWLVKF